MLQPEVVIKCHSHITCHITEHYTTQSLTPVGRSYPQRICRHTHWKLGCEARYESEVAIKCHTHITCTWLYSLIDKSQLKWMFLKTSGLEHYEWERRKVCIWEILCHITTLLHLNSFQYYENRANDKKIWIRSVISDTIFFKGRWEIVRVLLIVNFPFL